MVNLTEHIEYLLRRHECVIVPDLGAFLAHSESATLTEDELTVLPPRRIVSFSGEVRRSDGLLVGSVARQIGVSFERGRQIVAEEVESLRHQLVADGELVFEGVGRLEMGPDGTTPTFTPAEKSRVNAQYALLLPVSAKVEAESESEVAILMPPPYGKQRKVRRPVGKWVAVAAMIAVVFGLGFIGFRYADLSMPTINHASLAPTTPTVRSTTAAPETTATPFEGVLTIALPGPDSKTEVSLAEQESPTSDRYYLVVASLKSDRQARRYIARMGDPTLKVLEVDGKYRVYAAEAATYAGAAAYKNEPHIAGRYSQSWVCTRLK